MKNLIQSNIQKDFYIWINPNNLLVKKQIEANGTFFSGENSEQITTNLMFIPNPDFNGHIRPFQSNLIQKYIVEYNFELCRESFFPQYPSRLNAIFLFHSEEEAQEYSKRHPSHTNGRILKKVKSIGKYIYSQHDSSWVDFMRKGLFMDQESRNNCCKTYWQGMNVEHCELETYCEVEDKRKPWNSSPVIETLFLGRIEFYNRDLKI